MRRDTAELEAAPLKYRGKFRFEIIPIIVGARIVRTHGLGVEDNW